MCFLVSKAATMPAARVSPADADRRHSSDTDLTQCQEALEEEEEEDAEEVGGSSTPYERAMRRLRTDEKWRREVSLGRRIGLYRIKEELGSGNFSQVRAAVHSLTKERVALKILDKCKLDKRTLRMLSREVGCMESLRHPHLVRLFEVLETPDKIFLAMEHAGGGELFLRISRDGHFSERAAKPLFAQITAAVAHMHAHRIVHRDLKAENVFFSSPRCVKVGDFGFSTRIRDPLEPLRTFCGSPPYAAPELFRDDSYAGPAVDVWALGVLLYFMLTAAMPFKAHTVAGLKRQILEGDYSLPEFLSPECRLLIRQILELDPEARIGLGQVEASGWLAGHTVSPVTVVDGAEGACPAATDRLRALGITEDMLEEARSRGCRSSVTGTYRIVTHRLLSEAVVEGPARILSPGDSPGATKALKNKKSKMCTIL